MGNTNRKLSKDDMDIYQLLTYFSKSEINECYDKFYEALDKETIALIENNRTEFLKVGLPHSDLINKIPEFKVNPFSARMLHVFSDGKNFMRFEDYLNMMSILGPSAPIQVKAKWAFKVYDFNDDNILDAYDIAQVVKSITTTTSSKSGENDCLTDEELKRVVDKVLEELDINENGYINETEFEHVADKSPEFQHSFKLRM